MAFVKGVVCEVFAQITESVERVLFGTNAKIAMREDVNLQRLNTSQEYPLTDIKLPVCEGTLSAKQQGSLNVLLDDLCLDALLVLQYLPTAVLQVDSTAPRSCAGFNDPNVAVSKRLPSLRKSVLEVNVFFDDPFDGYVGGRGEVFFTKVCFKSRLRSSSR